LLTLASAIELARCVRDLPTLSGGFAACERLCRERVGAIAAAVVETNRRKCGGPAARMMIRLLAPVFTGIFLAPEMVVGSVRRYRIGWGQTGAARAYALPRGVSVRAVEP
jgi:hypothetical protein